MIDRQQAKDSESEARAALGFTDAAYHFCQPHVYEPDNTAVLLIHNGNRYLHSYIVELNTNA